MTSAITRLEVAGMKSTDRDIELAPLTLILGPVGSGKTTLLDALRYLALGYVPGLGQTPAATSRLMREDELSVRAVLSDGRTLERQLNRRSKSLRSEALASWLDLSDPKNSKVTPTDVGNAIRELFGASDLEAAEHLDLRELLNVSADKRARRLEELLAASAIGPDDLAARGAALTILRIAAVPPDRMPAGREASVLAATVQDQMVPVPQRAACREVAHELERTLRARGITAALQLTSERKLAAGDETRRRVGERTTLEDLPLVELAELGPLEGQFREVTVARARAERDLAEAKRAAKVRSDVEATITAARAKVDLWERGVRACTTAPGTKLTPAEELRAQAARVQDPAAPLPSPRIDELELEATQLVTEASALVDPPERPRGQVELESASMRLDREARDILDAIAKNAPPEPIGVLEEESQLAMRVRDLRQAATSPWRDVASQALQVEAIILEVDPDSRQVLTRVVARLRELAAANSKSVVELESKVAEAEASLVLARERAAARDVEIATAKAQISERRDVALAKRREAADLHQQEVAARANEDRATLAARSATQLKRAELLDRSRVLREEAQKLRGADVNAGESHKRELARLTEQRKALLDQAAILDQSAAAAQRALEVERANLAAAESQLAGVASVAVDPVTAQRSLDAAIEQLATLQPKLERLREAEARRRRMDVLTKEVTEWTAWQRAWTEAEWAVKRLRDEDLAQRAQGLEARMATFLTAAGRAEAPFVRVAPRGGAEFGWRRGGREISIEALSGGESVLYTTALAAAILALRAPQLRVLLVEGADVGMDGAASGLLRGLEAVAGELSNILVATCVPLRVTPPGWTVIRTTAPVQEMAHA